MNGNYMWKSNGQEIDSNLWAPIEPRGKSFVRMDMKWIRYRGLDDTHIDRYKRVLCEKLENILFLTTLLTYDIQPFMLELV